MPLPVLDTEQTRTTGITEMNKPNHPEGVEGATPIHYPSPEEVAKAKELFEKFNKCLKGELDWSEIEAEMTEFAESDIYFLPNKDEDEQT